MAISESTTVSAIWNGHDISTDGGWEKSWMANLGVSSTYQVEVMEDCLWS